MKNLKVSDDVAKALKIYLDNIKDCDEAIKSAGHVSRGYRKALWDLIFSEYPEIDRKTQCTYDELTEEIIYQDKKL